MSRTLPMVLGLVAGVLGCSTVGGVESAAPDAGAYRQFDAPLSKVVVASDSALLESGFATTEKTPEGDSALVIVATRGASFASYGEIVRIRMVRADSATTKVWIHTKRRMATNIFATGDWSKALFAAMQLDLGHRQALASTYRLLLVDGDIRIFDMHLLPGDTTPFHVHDAATLYIPSAVSTIDGQVRDGPWGALGPEDAARFQPGAVLTDTAYLSQPLTHRVTNVGANPFHVVEVTNGDPGVVPGRGSAAPGVPGVLESSSPWFRQTRLALAPAASTAWYTPPTPVVLVLSGEGHVSAERGSAGAAPSLLNALGDWAYIPAGTRFRLRNEGQGSSAVVVIEVR